MTDVWRKMQGVDTHESVSNARYLNIMFFLQTSFDLVERVNSIQCRYSVDGDTIAWDHFETSDEALDWIHDKILDELEINQKALNNGHTNQ
jgi:hypothetical protein